jgi:acetone carboxylase gamma subunit
MKCVCGYEHTEEWDSEIKAYKTITGDSDFIEIDGKFTVNDGDPWHRNQRDIRIYACPKCGTLKINSI